MAKSIDLTIIILNYNSQFWLKKTLTTLKEHFLDKTKKKWKVVVVDNNSADDSVLMVRQDFDWVDLIELDQNLGYSAGNNVALKEVESDYVLLLNNDVELTEDSNFDQLIKFANKKPKAGVFSPQVQLADGQLDQACHRGEPTPWASLTYFSGLEKLAAGSGRISNLLDQLSTKFEFFDAKKLFGQYHLIDRDLTKPHKIDACTGAAMLVKTQVMKKVGLLDERFFMYAEDLDWCRRFRQAGYQVWYYPQVKIIHHKYKSGIKTESDLTSLQTKIYFYNTMLQYYDKHFRGEYPGIVRSLLRAFIFIKKGGM
ncbi:MAG: glycosyltransferase [Candidatus Pacebacteria bacterium]|nr:glycosyltransferase [Candidatus Paceibacterota bacterium]